MDNKLMATSVLLSEAAKALEEAGQEQNNLYNRITELECLLNLERDKRQRMTQLLIEMAKELE